MISIDKSTKKDYYEQQQFTKSAIFSFQSIVRLASINENLFSYYN
jgi:hypothetical protein